MRLKLTILPIISISSHKADDVPRQTGYAEVTESSAAGPAAVADEPIKHNEDREERSPGQISSSYDGSPRRRSISPHRDEPWHSPITSTESLPQADKEDRRPEENDDLKDVYPLAARILGPNFKFARPPSPASPDSDSERRSKSPVSPRIPVGPRVARAASASQPVGASPKNSAGVQAGPSGQPVELSAALPPRSLSDQQTRSLADQQADFQPPRSLRDRLGPPPVQSPRSNTASGGLSSSPPTRPRAMSQQLQAYPSTVSRRDASAPSLRKTVPPSPVQMHLSMPKQPAAPLESSRQSASNQPQQRTPSPVRTETSEVSTSSSNPPPSQVRSTDQASQPLDLSPKLENKRPQPNASYAASSAASQKPSVSPRPLVERRESQTESLRAPLPLRSLTQEATLGLSSTTISYDKQKFQLETPSSAGEPIVDQLGSVVESDTIQAQTSTSIEPDTPRPSSSLSDLPHSQVLPEQAEGDGNPDEELEEHAAAGPTEFDRTLQSFIEEESGDLDLVDPDDIIEENRFKVPMELPLAVAARDAGDDPHTYAAELLQQHSLLEPFLLEQMRDRDERRGIKIFRLRQEYRELDQEWQIHCTRLEKIRERQKKRHQAAAPPLTPAIDASGLPFVPAPATPSMLAPSGRSNRRSAAASLGYGDAARSEAEFLEILARLEDADMADPNLRAMRTTATVPDMVIEDGEREMLIVQSYSDENGLVVDPVEHYGINKLPDSWTEEEIAIFCRRYASHPKQFGKIAAALPNKTTPQCVLFYYRSKKKIDFRALVDKRSRDGKRKKGRKGEVEEDNSGVKKGPSLLGNLKRSRVEDEDEDDDDDEPQTPGSAIARESAVLSTAKALTRQLHGATSDDATIFAEAAQALIQPARMPVSRQPSTNKKAARFLSPPPSGIDALDGLAPASDGALAAAEVLGGLAGALEPTTNVARIAVAGGKKKRKPSMSEPNLDGSFGDEGTPRSATSNKRARAITSSYWSVADKNEFVRLLGVHGKNWSAISGGIESKTAVQCKNVSFIIVDVDPGLADGIVCSSSRITRRSWVLQRLLLRQRMRMVPVRAIQASSSKRWKCLASLRMAKATSGLQAATSTRYTILGRPSLQPSEVACICETCLTMRQMQRVVQCTTTTTRHRRSRLR